MVYSVGLPGDGEKPVAAPDDLPVLGPEDHHGEGGVHHCVLACAVNIVVQGGDEAGDLLLPPPLGDEVIGQQQQDHQGLQDREQRGKIKGSGGKHHVDQEKDLHLGFRQPF